MKRGRLLTDEERQLWRGVARSIKPLRRTALLVDADDVAPPPPREVKAAPVAKPTAPRKEKPAPALAPIERRAKQKLARGTETIDLRLDLHGMTQSEAHAALARFLRRAQNEGARFVLVVTGKGGRGDGQPGVLRRQVPLWLGLPEFRGLVVGFDTARSRHGGEGALYVRVRRG